MEKVFFFYNKLSIWLAFRSEDFFCHVPDITLPTKHKNLDLASPRRIKDFRHESLVKSQKFASASSSMILNCSRRETRDVDEAI